MNQSTSNQRGFYSLQYSIINQRAQMMQRIREEPVKLMQILRIAIRAFRIHASPLSNRGKQESEIVTRQPEYPYIIQSTKHTLSARMTELRNLVAICALAPQDFLRANMNLLKLTVVRFGSPFHFPLESS